MYKADLPGLMECVRLGFVPGRTDQAAIQGFSGQGGGEALFLLESAPGAVVIGPQR